MKKAITALLCLLIPFQPFATSIVIAIVGNFIYAAADSKSVVTDQYGRLMRVDTIRKIFVKKNMGFAIAGHFDSVLRMEASLSIREGRSPKVCGDTFAARMKKQYQWVMEMEKETAPPEYQYYLHNALGDVVFFQVKNAVPSLCLVEIVMNERNGKTVISQNSYATPFVAIGIADHIISISPQEHQKMRRAREGHWELYCADLVQVELSKHVADIGCPIRTMAWTSKGITWGKAQCR
ncbi:MAG TPA: hypothetical protein VHE34_22315 [Puia sp.]|uniref:hypothetical protein n=1 Tax=Puia sp. TaxID=2045100 RepID=UPI002C137E67|nr:hypothetical protein [Puia sp.]HVU97982.1 hypothetical protein [Puia sp.]